jgi:uncharacterized protein (DUF302 family)
MKRLSSTHGALALLVVLQLLLLRLTPAVRAQRCDANGDDNGDDIAEDAIGLVKVKSLFSFTETYDRLLTALRANAAIKIVAEVDHQRNAQSVGLELAAPVRLVVFGNAALGTPLMLCNQIAGLDLPQTVLVWQADNTTAVYVGYNSIVYLRARHPGLNGVATLGTIAGGLSALTRAATGVNNTDADDSDNLGRRDFNQIRNDMNRGLFQRNSNADFNTTWTRLIKALESAAPTGLKIAYQVDHAANAPNKDLNPTRVVVFANPILGTRLLQVNPTVGIDLPLKILVTQDANNGTVRVSTNRLGFLQYRHGLFDYDDGSKGIEETLSTIRTAILNFVRIAATGKPNSGVDRCMPLCY